MEQPLTLILIEDEQATCQEIKQCIENCEDLNLLAITNSSHDALELVHMHLPNLIILDIELHFGSGNGILFLNALKQLELHHPPFILVTTHNMSEVTLAQIRELGADFILAKYEQGYCAEYIVENIRLMRPAILRKNATTPSERELSPAETEQKIIKRIQRELDLVGINPKAVGYNYLVDSILLIMNGEDSNISRVLAPKYKKSEKSIERAMQNAIKQAWVTTDVDDLLKYYTAKIRIDRGSPTLMEFVCYYANKLKFDVE